MDRNTTIVALEAAREVLVDAIAVKDFKNTDYKMHLDAALEHAKARKEDVQSKYDLCPTTIDAEKARYANEGAEAAAILRDIEAAKKDIEEMPAGNAEAILGKINSAFQSIIISIATSATKSLDAALAVIHSDETNESMVKCWEIALADARDSMMLTKKYGLSGAAEKTEAWYHAIKLYQEAKLATDNPEAYWEAAKNAAEEAAEAPKKAAEAAQKEKKTAQAAKESAEKAEKDALKTDPEAKEGATKDTKKIAEDARSVANDADKADEDAALYAGCLSGLFNEAGLGYDWAINPDKVINAGKKAEASFEAIDTYEKAAGALRVAVAAHVHGFSEEAIKKYWVEVDIAVEKSVETANTWFNLDADAADDATKAAKGLKEAAESYKAAEEDAGKKKKLMNDAISNEALKQAEKAQASAIEEAKRLRETAETMHADAIEEANRLRITAENAMSTDEYTGRWAPVVKAANDFQAATFDEIQIAYWASASKTAKNVQTHYKAVLWHKRALCLHEWMPIRELSIKDIKAATREAAINYLDEVKKGLINNAEEVIIEERKRAEGIIREIDEYEAQKQRRNEVDLDELHKLAQEAVDEANKPEEQRIRKAQDGVVEFSWKQLRIAALDAIKKLYEAAMRQIWKEKIDLDVSEALYVQAKKKKASDQDTLKTSYEKATKKYSDVMSTADKNKKEAEKKAEEMVKKAEDMWGEVLAL